MCKIWIRWCVVECPECRFTVEEALAQFWNWDSDVEEEISETEDISDTEDNVVADTDFQFSNDEEDSGDGTEIAENQGMQQSSSTEETWTSKDSNIKWSTSPHQSQGRLSSSNVTKMTPGPTRFAVT